jgi:hypothetical protein
LGADGINKHAGILGKQSADIFSHSAVGVGIYNDKRGIQLARVANGGPDVSWAMD